MREWPEDFFLGRLILAHLLLVWKPIIFFTHLLWPDKFSTDDIRADWGQIFFEWSWARCLFSVQKMLRVFTNCLQHPLPACCTNWNLSIAVWSIYVKMYSPPTRLNSHTLAPRNHCRECGAPCSRFSGILCVQLWSTSTCRVLLGRQANIHMHYGMVDSIA